MGKKGQSLNRMRKRGRVDMFGKPLLKRPFNNAKRTKGRQKQEDVKMHYLDMMKRVRYIKQLADKMVEDGVTLTKEDWKKQVREYDKHQLLFDDYERTILFERVNNAKNETE